jgi:hypothetical protein
MMTGGLGREGERRENGLACPRNDVSLGREGERRENGQSLKTFFLSRDH